MRRSSDAYGSAPYWMPKKGEWLKLVRPIRGVPCPPGTWCRVEEVGGRQLAGTWLSYEGSGPKSARTFCMYFLFCNLWEPDESGDEQIFGPRDKANAS